jgi:hypothetical protein
MVLLNSLQVPTNNHCAQCAQTIREPEWMETSGNKVMFVWRCTACDYEFETTAIYPPQEQQAPLAA